MILGTDYTAAEIYSLYRILRVVCLKRRKDRCSARGGPPSSGSRVSGMAGAAVKREFKSSKELLIDEYATLMAPACQATTTRKPAKPSSKRRFSTST